jgi:hypothetical protein
MATTIEVTEENGDIIEEVLENIADKTGIRLNRKNLIPFLFVDPRELTDIAIRNMQSKINRKY